MKKRVLVIVTASVVLLAIALLIFWPRKEIPNNIGSESGIYSEDKLTAEELRELYGSLPSVETLYATEPDTEGEDYSPAVLTEEAYQYTLAWVNYYRVAAGLPKVSFKEELNESAAWGALLLAMSGEFSHTPAPPEDMTQSDFKTGFFATSSSNLSLYSTGAGNADVADVLKNTVAGQMNDSDSENIDKLGHRRWLLYPFTLTMGLGVADSTTDYHNYYSVIRVLNRGVETGKVGEYDFIAWPASGNNLSDTFYPSSPWSVSLNPEFFKTPSSESVRVFITREEDGKIWNFSRDTDISELDGEHSYFNVETSEYGLDNVIIFRPPYSKITEYSGRYRVIVAGIYDRAGRPRTLSYTVNFFLYEEKTEEESSENRISG